MKTGRGYVPKVIALALGVGVLSACSGNVPGWPYPPRERDAPALDVLAYDNNLELVIGTHPALESALGAVAASRAQIGEADAARMPQLGVGVDVGWDAARVINPIVTGAPVAMANMTLTQLVADGGQQRANRDRVEVEHLRARMEFALTGDQLMQELISAYRQRQSAARTLQIIDKHMGEYRERRPQIDAAAARGMMTNSDVIEIDAVVNQIQAKRVDAQLAADAAQATILAILGEGAEAKAAERELAAYLGKSDRADPTSAPGYRALAIASDMDHLLALENIATVSTRPSTSVQAQLRTPLYNPAGVQGYVGVNISWSLFDGGAAKARAESLAAQRQATARTADALEREIAAADRAYQAVRARAGRKRDLLRERIRLSAQRIEEMQKMLVAGQADVSSIAQEIIAGAEAELGLVALDDEVRAAQMASFAVRGGVCAMIDACNLLEGVPEL